ncbi:MAG: SDR family oxidoreductase [Anaeromyxobacter sp.]|nr:SDR family oxidoreductase [Anaeromyxobacter sp.]
MPHRRSALIIGATGQVGSHAASALRAAGWSVIRAGNSRAGGRTIRVDVADPESVRRAVRDASPGLCVLAGGMTAVDRCEQEPSVAEQVNARGPEVVAGVCRDVGAKLVFLSTEYVFDGTAGPYGEEDPVCPISIYGRTKLAGERAVLAADASNLIVRTTVVYSFRRGDKNFLMQVLEKLSRGEAMSVPSDQVSSPTYAPALGCAIAAVAEEASGTLNIAGPEAMPRLDFARRIAVAFGLDTTLLRGVTTRELGQVAPRPLQAGLRTEKLHQHGLIPVGAADALPDALRIALADSERAAR